MKRISLFFVLLLASTASARDIIVDNVAALASTRAAPNDTVTTLGYVNAGDGGGQTLRYSNGGGTVDDGFIFDAPGAGGERFIAIDQQVINVRKWGAVGLNATADTDAFTRAIAELKKSGSKAGTIFVPQGNYFINATLDFGTVRGWVLQGVGGNSIQTAESSSYPDAGSNICWAGADGGQLMMAAGAGFKIRDIAFFGSVLPQAGQGHHRSNRAGLGFQLYFVTGIGSGDAIWENTNWVDFDVAIQMSSSANQLTDGNCADLYFNRIQFAYCDQGFKVWNSQGVNYHFNNVQLYGLNDGEIFARFERGGSLQVDFAHLAAIDTLCSVGANAGGNYKFGTVKVDSTATKTPKLFTMESTAGAFTDTDSGVDNNRFAVHASFDAVQISADVQFTPASETPDRPIFCVRGSANLEVKHMAEIDNTALLLHLGGSATPFVGYPRVRFENCDIVLTGIEWDDDPSWITGTKSQLGWRFINCHVAGLQSEILPEIGRRKTITNADGAIPNVRGADTIICNHSSPITLTYFAGKEDGDEITVFLSTNTSLSNALDNIHLNGGTGLSAPGFGGVIRLKRKGAAWWEVSRSIL